MQVQTKEKKNGTMDSVSVNPGTAQTRCHFWRRHNGELSCVNATKNKAKAIGNARKNGSNVIVVGDSVHLCLNRTLLADTQ